MFSTGISKFVAAFMMIVSGLAFAQPQGRADEQSLLSAFAAYTDLRMQGVQRTLAVLAATPEARSAHWNRMQPLLTDYQKSDEGLVVWFLRPDGSYYTVDRGRMDVKLSDRSYFPELMAGRTVMGALVVSKSTGQRSAVIAVPVMHGSKVIGAVGASLFLDRLAEQVDAALSLRQDAAFFAMAPSGQTALHRKSDRHFLDPRELGSETLKKAANEMLANPAGETAYSYDNAAKKAIYRTSPLTQWKFVITSGESRQK